MHKYYKAKTKALVGYKDKVYSHSIRKLEIFQFDGGRGANEIENKLVLEIGSHLTFFAE